MKEMVFTREAYAAMTETVGTFPAETGGILLGNRDDYVVQKFIFDANASTGSTSYDPDIAFLNREVKREWEENGLAFLGFVHSHPRGLSRLSGDMGNGIGDQGYIQRIFDSMPNLTHFLAPIVFPSSGKMAMKIFPHIVRRENVKDYKTGTIRIVPAYAPGSTEPQRKTEIDTSRIEGAVSAKKMAESHVVCVGIGGASGICEDLVRTGLGALTVIDFDHVDPSNLTTQGYERRDISVYKAKALGRRIRRINPMCTYIPIEKNFLEMDEDEIEAIISGADVLLMMTDDFQAQARGNLVSLKYQIPTVFGIMYEKARGAEITFNLPGVTPACHRCATSPRYEQYDQGYTNQVTSQASTVFHTHYFNSAIGMITLALLHNDIEGVEFGNWFGTRWDRNLIQLRLNPRYAEGFPDGRSLFERTFSAPDAARRTFAFDAIWQTIEPETPPRYAACLDCGGVGDLRQVVINRSI